MTRPDDTDVDAVVAEHGDLVERIAQGDGLALAELLEHGTGAKALSVKVTLPRPAAPPAGG